MRGKQLFKNIVSKEEEQERRPGRSENLMALRNKCLLNRYFYYGFYKRKTYDDILNLLVAEFFITAERISRIVQQNTTVLREMKDRKTSLYYMQSRWPHYRW